MELIQIGSKSIFYSDFVLRSLSTGSIEMLEWISDLIQTTEVHAENILEKSFRFAVFSKTNMLETYLHKLECRSILNTLDPKLTLKIGKEEGGLLAVLCYANADISKKEIWQHLENLEPSLESFNFMGKTALHYAINHGNVETVEALLLKEDWRNYFLGFIDGSGTNILDYAAKVGTEDNVCDIILEAFHAKKNSSTEQHGKRTGETN